MGQRPNSTWIAGDPVLFHAMSRTRRSPACEISTKDALGASNRAEAVRRALQFFVRAIEVDNGKERMLAL